MQAEFNKMDLTETFTKLGFHRTNFKCNTSDKFMTSLNNHGYTEFLHTVMPSQLIDWKHSTHGPDACEPTCHADTGHIYFEKYDCYYNISIVNIGYGRFDIVIEPIAYPYRDNNIDAMIKAFE